jgi:hypothetical protein
VSAISYRDVMPRVMRRVALEVASCLRAQAGAAGGYPAPAPLCAQASGGPDAWLAVPGAHFGRVADAAWPEGCNVASPATHSWWKAWRAGVFYAARPASLDILDAAGRAGPRARDAAVIVAGPPLARAGFVQHRDSASLGDASQWLEATNALLESATGCGAALPAFACEAAGTCTRITQSAPTREFNDVVLALP